MLFFLFLIISIALSVQLTPEQEATFNKQFEELTRATQAKDYAEALSKMLHVDPECILCYVKLTDKSKLTPDKELHEQCNRICHDRKRTHYIK